MNHTSIPRSAHVRSAAYDPDEGTMQITFHNGETYEYRGVPDHVYWSFMDSPSKGQYIHKHIKPRFRGEMV